MGFLKKIVKSVTAPFNPKTYIDAGKNFLEKHNYGNDYSLGINAINSNGSGNGFISGAVGLGQDILAASWNTSQQSLLNNQAFQQNLKMWNLQNAYNDPVAQMQRLANAGLNPNLVYGGGNVTGNTTSNYPTYEPVKYSGVGQFLNRTQQKEIAMAQLNLGMQEFQQRVTNQGIQNGIAIEKLDLYRKINDAMLKNYFETTRSKKLLNDYFENPLEILDENGNININSQQVGQLIKIMLGAMH